jgi:hypothetical protein
MTSIISWKGATFRELSAGVKYNSAPTASSASIFLPNTLRIYRKEIASTPIGRCNPRTSVKIEDYNMPGGTLSTNVVTTTGLANTGDLIYENNTCEHPSSVNQCNAFLSPADNARRRVRSSGMIKKQTANNDYYTSTQQYLNSRNISYDQNQFFHVKYGSSTAKPGSAGAISNIYQSNGINKCAKYTIPLTNPQVSFTYYWVDNTANVVTVPAGQYDIDDFNLLLQNAMVTNFHYYTTATLTKVFLLSLVYDNVTNTISIYAKANTLIQYPVSRYLLPLTSPSPTWNTSLDKIPGILITNTIIGNALGFATNTASTTYPYVLNRVSTTNRSVQGAVGPGIQPRYRRIYYKPSNSQFGVQGAVSSSDRLLRKKYDTITTVGSSFRSAFGEQTANALAYGSSSYGYTLKERMGYPMNCTPTFPACSEVSVPIVTDDLSILDGIASSDISGMTQVSLPGALYDVYPRDFAALDDGDVPIPMAGMIFNFFGANRTNSVYWSSNNALVFGTPRPELESNISRNEVPAILLGNYDRVLKTFSYSNSSFTNYSTTTILVRFYDYFEAAESDTTYQYKIRLIKENRGSQRQFVEVYVISSPPSPGYSSAITSYPSGSVDSLQEPIDTTKNSPYNITNGISFLNPCGATYSLASPTANTSFVFVSDSTGTRWRFVNNAYVNA